MREKNVQRCISIQGTGGIVNLVIAGIISTSTLGHTDWIHMGSSLSNESQASLLTHRPRWLHNWVLNNLQTVLGTSITFLAQQLKYLFRALKHDKLSPVFNLYSSSYLWPFNSFIAYGNHKSLSSDFYFIFNIYLYKVSSQNPSHNQWSSCWVVDYTLMFFLLKTAS